MNSNNNDFDNLTFFLLMKEEEERYQAEQQNKYNEIDCNFRNSENQTSGRENEVKIDD